MTQLFKCPGCGGPVSPAAQACPRCGQTLESQVKAPAAAAAGGVAATVEMPQPSEGALPSPQGPAAAPGADPVAVMQEAKPRKRRRIGLIIGLSVGIPVGVLLILVVGGAILGMFMYREAESEMMAMAEAEQQLAVAVDLTVLETAVEVYRLQRPGACPGIAELQAAGHLTADTNTFDPWGSQYVIACPGDAIDAYSLGPDRLAGTIDDIHN